VKKISSNAICLETSIQENQERLKFSPESLRIGILHTKQEDNVAVNEFVQNRKVYEKKKFRDHDRLFALFLGQNILAFAPSLTKLHEDKCYRTKLDT